MLIKELKIENLPVYVYNNRQEMGKAAAIEAAEQLRSIIKEKGEANVVYAAAPSQSDMLAALLNEDVDWQKVRGFCLDEFIGLDTSHPAGFANFLRRNFFDHKDLKEIHLLECSPEGAEKKMAEYVNLLDKYPPDIAFLGIGENGHLAFNDPHIADFNDPLRIKIVEMDLACRTQQVNDGCFSDLSEVPTHAITLTLSQIMAVPRIITVVPTKLKAHAVKIALTEPISTKCPAGILRTHKNAKLYLDKDSAEKL